MNEYAYIADIEYYLPEARLTNEELAQDFPDWNVEKISSKTGIYSRRIASENETALDLAEKACQKLFASAACKPKECDCLIFCTQSPDYILPPNSCLLQTRLGLPQDIQAFDITHGCSGYVYGLNLAKALIESGQCRNVLFVTSDTYTHYLNPKDRSVRTIFGDGAAATLITGKKSPVPFMEYFTFATDGRGAGSLIVPGSGSRRGQVIRQGLHAKALDDGARTLDDLYMNGPEVYTYTMRSIPPLIRRVLDSSGLGMDDVDHFVFHQANAYMLDGLRRKCGIPENKFSIFLRECGNTVSTSIPLLLCEALKKGSIKKGQKLLMAGFGVGYASAAAIITI